MSKSKIVVIGSTNTDMVIKTSKLPAPGETILGGDFYMNAGGKGANQAVAAARLGAEVTFVAKIGDDIFGQRAKELLIKEGIKCDYVFVDKNAASGVAQIVVDAKGENSIVVAPGANNYLKTEDVMIAFDDIINAEIILMQLETPMATIEDIAALASTRGKKVILNPAPACFLSSELLKSLYLITPNETEAELLTGIKVTDVESATKAAIELQSKGVENVIITMGSMGAFLYTNGKAVLVPTQKVVAVDTTAAGDTFNGGLAVALAEGKTLLEAVEFGNKAAAISVTRFGAQSSVPYLSEIN